ncbi:hypothetical protein DSO57_1031477 [Entomophthora muscae]|uniref:Uncharacterized protein n=1 Tax=Entomophthora muscae TaxID=34485 RepID=A0ACC2TN10_9FUNG|nr:hypothetical protein DSO57_1031477 [Entomophthora muscae]
MDICITELITTTGLTNLIVADSNAPELTPAYTLMGPKVKDIIARSSEAPRLFHEVITKIRKRYPQTNIFEADIGGLARSVANGTLAYSKTGKAVYGKACLNPPFDLGIGIAEPEFCPNPEDFMFWDAIHPTTSLHKKLAEYIVKEIS